MGRDGNRARAGRFLVTTVPMLASLNRDAEGFLNCLEDWSPEVARALAAEEHIEMTPAHQEIVNVMRTFYIAHHFAPPMRGLIKVVRQQLGPEKASSIYILKLFPGRPVKLISKLAGIPIPDHCL